jgi:hypothetical protein
LKVHSGHHGKHFHGMVLLEDRELANVIQRPGVKTYELAGNSEEDEQFNQHVQGRLIFRMSIESQKVSIS